MRWMVVDKNRTPIWTAMASKDAAEDEARVLNETGLPEFAPYRVVEDEVAWDLMDRTDEEREYQEGWDRA